MLDNILPRNLTAADRGIRCTRDSASRPCHVRFDGDAESAIAGLAVAATVASTCSGRE